MNENERRWKKKEDGEKEEKEKGPCQPERMDGEGKWLEMSFSI